MRILLILFMVLLLTTPCFAGQWICVKDQTLDYTSDKTINKCDSYSSFRLKKPIVKKSTTKYKNIVETFDRQYTIRHCVNN